MSAQLGTSARLYLDTDVVRGPMLTRNRQRALRAWLAMAVLGLLPSVFGLSTAWRAFGLSAWFPGAGFLYSGDPLLAVLVLAVFAASMVAWLFVGGFIFPILVWLLSALLATAKATGADVWAPAQVLVPALAGLGFALLRWREARGVAQARIESVKVRDYLAQLPLIAPELNHSEPDEMSEADIGAMRYLLNLTLQSIDCFDGFTTIDQFREAAWRYQLFSFNYALGSLQANRLPAFRGYLEQAQRNAIIKTMDHRVWCYWRFENFVGNMKIGGDPIAHQNIMYSGWWGLALGTFERSTGNRCFSEPGALTHRERSGKTYVYDYPSVMQAVARNFDLDALCFFPCEPNWVFEICNLFGFTGMLMFDNEHGTRLARDRLERFTRTLEREFTFADGRSVILTSNRTGLSLISDGSFGFMINAWLLNMVSPRLAQVYWALARRKMLETSGGDLSRHEPRGAERVDVGNYTMSPGWYWGSLMASAREMGDEEIYQLASRRHDEMGITRDANAWAWVGSPYANAMAHVGRFSSKDSWHRLANGAQPLSRSGPLLDSAAYPDVIVCMAKSRDDRLDLVLRPGAAVMRTRLGFAGLKPGISYRVTGVPSATLRADHEGRASLEIDLQQRTVLSLAPEM